MWFLQGRVQSKKKHAGYQHKITGQLGQAAKAERLLVCLSASRSYEHSEEAPKLRLQACLEELRAWRTTSNEDKRGVLLHAACFIFNISHVQEASITSQIPVQLKKCSEGIETTMFSIPRNSPLFMLRQ